MRKCGQGKQGERRRLVVEGSRGPMRPPRDALGLQATCQGKAQGVRKIGRQDDDFRCGNAGLRAIRRQQRADLFDDTIQELGIEALADDLEARVVVLSGGGVHDGPWGRAEPGSLC